MNYKIKNIIKKVVSEYWKPYEVLEKEIEELLKKENIIIDSIIMTGDINNIYVYIQINKELYVFNEKSDKSNAYLLKEYNIDNVKFEDEIAVISNFNEKLNIPRVCLINMCVLENFPIPRLNLSTASIAAYLRKQQKAKVKIIDMQLRTTIDDIEKVLNKDKFEIIGISISFGQKDLSEELISKILNIKGIDKSKIIVGNVIPSLYNKYYLNRHKEIIVSYREGEETFVDLVDYVSGKKDIKEVSGIAYIDKDGKYQINGINLFDITNLPFPAVDTIEEVFKYKGALTLELSRGCNYSKCTFCPREHKGAKWRGLSVDSMVLYFETLNDICKKFNKEPFFYIADEEFIGQLPHELELKRIEEFCEKIKQLGLNIKFDVSARVDSIFKSNDTKEENINHMRIWKLLKEIGLQRLFLGVESGSDNQLQRFNKGTTAYQNATALKLITALGINTRIGYISFDPLMENFDDIIESHRFVERKDILYKPVNLNEISIEEIYEEIVTGKNNGKLKLQNVPLYNKVSYPLTSLEVLFGTAYAGKVMKCEENNSIQLITGIEMNMARYNTKYFNDRIGKVSDYCQKWIDYNFPVLYSLKGLYKTSKGPVKERIYGLMSWAKSIDHYLLNYIMYELNEINQDRELEEFAKSHKFEIEQFKGTDEEIINMSINSWQKLEEIFIKETKKMLNDELILDTNDLALTNAIDKWEANRGVWNKINDKEEKIEEDRD